MDCVREAVGCVPKKPIENEISEGEADPTSSRPNSDGDPLFENSQYLVDLLVKYGKLNKRTIGVVQREEDLLSELLARTKRERMRLQYMGARPAIKRQTGSRNNNQCDCDRENSSSS